MAVAEPSEELDDYERAQHTQFRLAAEALAAGVSREAVRVAYNGFGTNIVPDLHKLRQNHAVVAAMAQRARRVMSCAGFETKRANEILIGRMKLARDAVETEWGVTEKTQPGFGSVEGERWVRLSLPVVNVTEAA